MEREEDVGKLLQLSGKAAQIILENGAETYRVEETVLRICRSYGYPKADVLALSTGVNISITTDQGSQAIIRRVRRRFLRLDKADRINVLSRHIAAGGVSMDEALAELDAINAMPPDTMWIQSLFAALSSGFFAVMFGGGVLEFFVAILCGGLAQLVGLFASKLSVDFIILPGLLGGLVCSLVTTGASYAFDLSASSVEVIISGAIMPLVTGLLMTNAIRDMLRGDLISSLSRAVEAMLTIVMVAVGIILIMRFSLPSKESVDLPIPFWPLATAAAALGSLFYARLIYLPKACLPLSIGIVIVTYGIYAILFCVCGWSEIQSMFICAIISALLCEAAAVFTKRIATIYLSIALVPLVPGVTLYRTMRELILGNSAKAEQLGLQAALTVGILALAVAVGCMTASMIRKLLRMRKAR